MSRRLFLRVYTTNMKQIGQSQGGPPTFIARRRAPQISRHTLTRSAKGMSVRNSRRPRYFDGCVRRRLVKPFSLTFGSVRASPARNGVHKEAGANRRHRMITLWSFARKKIDTGTWWGKRSVVAGRAAKGHFPTCVPGRGSRIRIDASTETIRGRCTRLARSKLI